MMAFFAPTSDSKVRSIKSSLACTSAWSQTSPGAQFSSMSRRLKENSVFDAEGNPTSISLKPHLTTDGHGCTRIKCAERGFQFASPHFAPGRVEPQLVNGLEAD